MLEIILVVLLILWLGGYIGYGRSRWGWGRSGDIGTIILVILILVLLFGPRW
jgi:hypothetical protein